MAIATLLSAMACIRIPITLNVTPTWAEKGTNFSMIQLKEGDRDKMFYVVREFAVNRGMNRVQAETFRNPEWMQEQYILTYKVKGFLYDTQHAIKLIAWYKDGVAAIQLVQSGDSDQEFLQFEAELLAALRKQFGDANVTKLGG